MVESGTDREETTEVWGGGVDGAVPEESSKSREFVSPVNRVMAVVAALALIISVTAFAGIGPAASLVDSDADGIYNWSDNCPDVANSKQLNFDGDANGDVCDNDDDNDLVPDTEDDLPLDPLESVDSDNDGIGDKADTDDDGDGTDDGQDAFPLDSSEDTDTDGDGVGDNADTDDDNDGVVDYIDSCPQSFSGHSPNDYDDDGCYDNEDDDEDNDGLDDWLDDCRQGWKSWTRDDTSDHDGDGCHDSFEDDDDDEDGLDDSDDDCPKGFTHWDSSSWKEDFDGDGCKDRGTCPDYCDEDMDDDGDGISDSADWYDHGDGHITLGITHWQADPNDCDYDSGCGSPDIYFRIKVDLDCDGSYDITYDQAEDWGTYYPDVRELGNGSYWLFNLTFDVPETFSQICYAIWVVDDDDGWFEDDEFLIYTEEGWDAYYFTLTLHNYLDIDDTFSTIGPGEGMQCSVTFHIQSEDQNGIHWDPYV